MPSVRRARGAWSFSAEDRITSVRPQLSGKRTTEPPKDYQVIGYRNQNEIEPIADPSETNQPGAQTGDIETLFKSLPVIKSLKKPKFFFQASPVRPKNVYGDEMETLEASENSAPISPERGRAGEGAVGGR
ncbi:hypothetical protein RR46_13854 [Papilio xuthus]|uniref:Uncharacterized protein n=1 Tax=Papilio xuthus TaxID=66420 RepID=A0A194PHV8_PAPXU|nr:hypothetical protein RR46_13854 [Papilio xuthus]